MPHPSKLVRRSPRPEDFRRHRRVDIITKARYLGDDGEERVAIVQDASVGGIFLHSVHKPIISEELIIYVDGFGRVEAEVVRHDDGGFAVQIVANERKKERLIEKLTLLANEAMLKSSGQAVFTPMTLIDKSTKILLDNGQAVDCQVLDFSLVSATLKTSFPIPLGQKLRIGKMLGSVTSITDDNLLVEFTSSGST